jgi:hypothetical protein
MMAILGIHLHSATPFHQVHHHQGWIHAIHHPADQMLYAGMNLTGVTDIAGSVIFQAHLIQFKVMVVAIVIAIIIVVVVVEVVVVVVV